jgi:hypothetical protein
MAEALVTTPVVASNPTAVGRGGRPSLSLTHRLAAIGRPLRNRKRALILAGAGLMLLLGAYLLIRLAFSGGSKTGSQSTAASQSSTTPTRPTATERTPPPPPSPARLSRYIFGDAALVVSLNVSQMSRSALYRAHQDRFKPVLQQLGGGLNELLDGTLDGTERVTLALPSDDMERPLFVLQGTYDRQKMRDALRSKNIPPARQSPEGGEFYQVQDKLNKSGSWFFALVNSNTFVVSPRPGYVVNALRRNASDSDRLRDSAVQAAIDNIEPQASVTVIVGGHLHAVNEKKEKGTLASLFRVRLVRGVFHISDGIEAAITFNGADAAAVDQIITILETVKTALRQEGQEVGELLSTAFADKPVRGREHTVSIRGQMNARQAARLLDVAARAVGLPKAPER